MKTLILMLIVLLLAGCEVIDPDPEDIEFKDPTTVCLNGVTYYAYTRLSGVVENGFLAVAYNPDGTLITCE